MTENTKLKKLKDLLIGCAFFDSLGIGFETQSYQEVQNYILAYPQWFTTFVYPTKNPYFDCSKFEPGIYTDDFQLTFAITKSLIQSAKIDIHDIAQKHMDEYLLSTNGWGNGTLSSVKRLIEGCSPFESGSKESKGNGVLMKITPIAYYFTVNKLNFHQQVNMINQITSMTHDNEMSRILTNLHVCLLIFLFTNKSMNLKEFNICCSTFKTLCYDVFDTKIMNDIYHSTVEQINQLFQKGEINDNDLLKISNNANFHQVDTFNLIWTLILLCGINDDLPLNAISLGGDTDTTGSILGSIVCVLRGSDWLQIMNPFLYQKLKRMNDIQLILLHDI
jgi:ADP-ribosylglycohydrolase